MSSVGAKPTPCRVDWGHRDPQAGRVIPAIPRKVAINYRKKDIGDDIGLGDQLYAANPAESRPGARPTGRARRDQLDVGNSTRATE